MREGALGLDEDAGRRVVEEVRATRLTLVDQNGSPRAALGIGDDGSPALRLFDPFEQTRAQLVVDPSGAANLKLHDRDGEVSAWLSVGPSGAPSLYLRGIGRTPSRARGHAELCVDEHGCPVLSLYDKDGQPRVLLCLGEKDGTPSLSFSSTRGDLRALLTGDAERGTLRLYPEPVAEPAVPALPLVPAAAERIWVSAIEAEPIPALALAPRRPNGEAPAIAARVPAPDAEVEAPRIEVAPATPEPIAEEPRPVEQVAEPAVAYAPAAAAPVAVEAPAVEEPTAPSELAPLPERAPAPAPRRRRRGPLALLLLVVGIGAGFGAAQLPLSAGLSVGAIEQKPVAQPAPASPGAVASPAGEPAVLRAIEAEEFVLKSKQGKAQARLSTLPDGSPFLTLAGAGGKGTIELSILPNQGAALKIGQGPALISVRAREDGSSEVTLHGSGPAARAAVFVHPDGTPVLSLADEAGRVRAGLTISGDGSPSLSLYDEESLRAFLGSGGNAASLMLLNKEGKVVFQAPR
jgi:hypothetical protein